MAGNEVVTRQGARRMVVALENAGVALVPSVPDTWIGWLMAVMRESPRLRVIDVTREEEAVAVACGAELVGARAAVVIQNAGLLNCGAVSAPLCICTTCRASCWSRIVVRRAIRSTTMRPRVR
jgi:sulfopyruvate decarboxylase TPP-binding subunit